MTMINGYDLETEAEHREVIAEQRRRDDEIEAWAGVCCSRGCRGPEPCEHVRFLVMSIRLGVAKRC